MIPLRIEGADIIMKGNGANVRDLHAKMIDGCFVSRWEPAPKELQHLLNGGSVELWVAGPSMPPVFLQAVENTFDER